MISKNSYNIFKKGSKTYFYTSLFFPKIIKEDVFTLYAFVRTADDLVDSIPQQSARFHAFVKEYQKALCGKGSGNEVITNFVNVSNKYSFEPRWIEAFLSTMEADLKKSTYRTLVELEEYMYGSAGVIGLMMAKILDLPSSVYAAAALQGKAMQYLNFIRDIDEDNSLGRTYIPKEYVDRAGLGSLLSPADKKDKEIFSRLIRSEIKRYAKWQSKAQKAYPFIPMRYRIPIKTAAMLYLWTGKKIGQNPEIVFQRKVKPSIFRIFLTLGKVIYSG